MSAKQSITGLFLALLFGCTAPSETSLSGHVTLNGRPLQDGYLTLFPVHGTQSTKGAKISDGRYQIEALTPGKWRAVITGTPEVQAAQHKSGVTTLKFSAAPNVVSPHAKGNQQVLDVHSGVQTVDFALQNPTPSFSR